MITALRIASVTFVLRDLLNNGLIDNEALGTLGVTVAVTVLPPDKIDTSIGAEQSQLNLFMYQATHNQGWKNIGLPSFNGKGDRINNPPLGIDLHYLLTAYGSQEFHTDILLGCGMQLLHETPVLERKAITASITAIGVPPSLKPLSDSALADQVEMITITPEVLSIEDISKLWAAFGAKYRPTAAYKVTVVLIESDKSTKSGPPVQTRNIYAIPFKKPLIEKVMSQSVIGGPVVEGQKILSSHFLILSGNDLYDENAKVTIDGKVVPATSIVTVADTQVTIQLTDDLNLKAGTHTVQTVYPIAMGKDSAPQHSGTASAPATFILSPQITSITPPTVAMPAEDAVDLTINVTPKLYPGQKIVLLLNAIAADVNGNYRSYSFQMSLPALSSPPDAVPVNNFSIPITGINPGTYLVRIQVDGVESPLSSIPASPPDSAPNPYSSPILVVS